MALPYPLRMHQSMDFYTYPPAILIPMGMPRPQALPAQPPPTSGAGHVLKYHQNLYICPNDLAGVHGLTGSYITQKVFNELSARTPCQPHLAFMVQSVLP